MGGAAAGSGGGVGLGPGTGRGCGGRIVAAMGGAGSTVFGCDIDTVDVTDARAVDEFVASVGRVAIRVNNAAGVGGRAGRPRWGASHAARGASAAAACVGLSSPPRAC